MSLYRVNLHWNRQRRDSAALLWFIFAIFGVVFNAFGCFVVVHCGKWIPEAKVRPVSDVEDVVISNPSMYGNVGFPGFQTFAFFVSKEPDFGRSPLSDFTFCLRSPDIEVGVVAGEQVSNLGLIEREDIRFTKIRRFSLGHNLDISGGDNILGRSSPDIIHANRQFESFVRDGLEFPVSMHFNHRPRLAFRGFTRGDKGIYGNIGGFFVDAVNEQRQSDVDKQQKRGDFRPEKLLFVVGCVVFLGGCVLLSKVLDKAYLDPGFNVNMAFGGFVFAAIMFWFGGWMVIHVLGLS